MTLQEPRGDETDEEALQRLGIQEEILLISSYDEWYGPIYMCPYCVEERIMQEFKFCPNCGGNMEGYGLETVAEEHKRRQKENE